MKFTGLINYQMAKEWELNVSDALVYDWLLTLPTWADPAIVEGKSYYFASRNRACEELPVITTKPDTMYRHYKNLEAKELISFTKISGKDYIYINPEMAKKWFGKSKDGNPTLGNKSEHSEINPDELGNKSENDSEINPTYKTISNNKTTRRKENKKTNKKETEANASFVFSSSIQTKHRPPGWKQWHEDNFALLWDAYAHKVDITPAMKAFMKIKEKDLKKIGWHVTDYVETTLAKGEVRAPGEFKPARKNLATYLNQRTFDDVVLDDVGEPTETPQTKKFPALPAERPVKQRPQTNQINTNKLSA